MASIRELASGRINVQVRRKGKKPQSRTFDTLDEAERWAESVERKEPKRAEACAKEAPQSPLSFMSLGKRYCDTQLRGKPSRSSTLYRIERIAQHLPDDARGITRGDVNQYRLMRLERVKPATCRDELQIIHRIYRWAHREMILDREETPSPCLDIAMPTPAKPRNRVVRKDELELLLSALSPVMRQIVELAYETAMRRGEIIKLRANHLALEERILSVVDGKTGDRSVPLTRRAVEILSEARERCLSPEGRLFPVTAHSVSTAVRRARKAVGLDDDVRLHQLRHTRITNVAKKGFNQAQIMMVSGHRDVRSVQRYTHLNVRDVIDLLE